VRHLLDDRSDMFSPGRERVGELLGELGIDPAAALSGLDKLARSEHALCEQRQHVRVDCRACCLHDVQG
jgi:hypothetical protein